jgi:acylphosphatase
MALICTAIFALVAASLSMDGPAPSLPTTRSTTQPAATQKSLIQNQPRRVHVIVTGRVQGVGFRAFTDDQARKLGLVGWVLNRSDGSVEAVVEGTADQVERLMVLIKRGPESARVEAVRAVDEPYKGEFKDFQVR